MAGKIHRRAAIAGFSIQRRPGLYIVGHIGNRDIECPASVAGPLCIHGIIKILRILAINGNELKIPQIKPPDGVFSRHLLAECPSFLFYCCCPKMRDFKTSQSNVDLDPRCRDITEYFGDLGQCLATLGGIVGDPRDHELSVSSAVTVFIRNDEFMGDPFTVRHDHAETRLLVIASHNLRMAAFEYVNHGAFLTPAAINARHPDHDPVSVKQPGHFLRA